MILNWMQKMGAAKTALAITLISILGALALEIGMSLIAGQMRVETIIKCIIFPGIIAPIVSYAVVRVGQSGWPSQMPHCGKVRQNTGSW
jgi:hypothetical protein